MSTKLRVYKIKCSCCDRDYKVITTENKQPKQPFTCIECEQYKGVENILKREMKFVDEDGTIVDRQYYFTGYKDEAFNEIKVMEERSE